eukprot:1042772-Prymnesium_polylepis.1
MSDAGPSSEAATPGDGRASNLGRRLSRAAASTASSLTGSRGVRRSSTSSQGRCTYAEQVHRAFQSKQGHDLITISKRTAMARKQKQRQDAIDDKERQRNGSIKEVERQRKRSKKGSFMYYGSRNSSSSSSAPPIAAVRNGDSSGTAGRTSSQASATDLSTDGDHMRRKSSFLNRVKATSLMWH